MNFVTSPRPLQTHASRVRTRARLARLHEGGRHLLLASSAPERSSRLRLRGESAASRLLQRSSGGMENEVRATVRASKYQLRIIEGSLDAILKSLLLELLDRSILSSL